MAVNMIASKKKRAGKGGATKAKATRRGTNIDGANLRIPRKTTMAEEAHGTVDGATTEYGRSQFGAYGAHPNKGRIRPRSPKGANMCLSRRLSRKIIQGSPLRSPM